MIRWGDISFLGLFWFFFWTTAEIFIACLINIAQKCFFFNESFNIEENILTLKLGVNFVETKHYHGFKNGKILKCFTIQFGQMHKSSNVPKVRFLFSNIVMWFIDTFYEMWNFNASFLWKSTSFERQHKMMLKAYACSAPTACWKIYIVRWNLIPPESRSKWSHTFNLLMNSMWWFSR